MFDLKLLQNCFTLHLTIVKGIIRSRLQPVAVYRRAMMMVCLHRASELASPLTRAATSQRSQITI